MPDLERKRLTNRVAPTLTTAYGIGSAFFGLIFVAAGGAILAVGLNKIQVEKSSVHAPMWVLTEVGAIFALAGLSVVVAGIRGSLRQRHKRELLRSRPNEPWMADYDWDRAGARASSVGKGIRFLWMAAFFLLFMLPFNWWAFLSGAGNFVVILVTGIFDLMTIGLFCAAVYFFIQYAKYGTSILRYDQFPFFLGGEAKLHFRSGTPIQADSMKFILRYVEERMETTGSGDNRSTTQVSYQVYADEIVMQLDSRGRFRPVEADLVFKLPLGDYSTRLSENPMWYWEVAATASTPGVDFTAVFLAPIYAKQA